MGANSNLTSCSSFTWKLPEVIQNFTCVFSNINVTPDGLLDVGPAPFRVEPIQCLYATSGVYAPALRATFYILCLLSLRFRRKDWISGVCMGIVMSYSSIAAIHAVILAWRRKILITGDIETVTVSSKDDIKIPIWPMSWDEDCDAVLAITGTAFLIIAPLAIWSDTVQQILRRNSRPDVNPRDERKKRILLIGWFTLLLGGLISAWVNEIFADVYSVEQFRFCSAGGELPGISSSSSLNLLGRQNPGKSFNATIWEIFSIPSISQGHLPTCVYPCFSAPGHRQDGDIRAIPSQGTWPSTSNYANTRAGWGLMITSIVLIAISFATVIILYTLERTGHLNYGRGGRVQHGNNQEGNPEEGNPQEGNPEEDGLPRGLLWWLDYGAKGLAIASFFIFVAWIEYTLWPFPYTERFSDVGQWGQLVTVILVLVFAAYDNWHEFVAACLRIQGRAITIYKRLRGPTQGWISVVQSNRTDRSVRSV
jgi:hypothetical protein